MPSMLRRRRYGLGRDGGRRRDRVRGVVIGRLEIDQPLDEALIQPNLGLQEAVAFASVRRRMAGNDRRNLSNRCSKFAISPWPYRLGKRTIIPQKAGRRRDKGHTSCDTGEYL